jgi:prepilin-type N-terminal cleavage/methylation domain-containing protein
MMNTTHNRGFTLVETLVAISILIVAVTGAYSAAQTGLSSATFSKDEVISFYLAQEGVEQIRNMRDENGLSSPQRNWLTNISSNSSDPCYFGKACTVDLISQTVIPCPSVNACPVVRQDPVNGYYGYDPSWNLTAFTRSIVLTSIGQDEISVLVTVTWSKGTVNRNFHAREIIMNWQ